MKNYNKALIIAIIAAICSCCPKTCKINKNSLEGKYLTSCDSIVRGYYQSLEITKDKDEYTVNFSGAIVKGYPGCQFNGKGKMNNDTLEIAVPREKNTAIMQIFPSQDKLGVIVQTKDFEQRYALMYYCSGGGSLADIYYNNWISKNKLGNITSDMSFENLKEQLKDQLQPMSSSVFGDKYSAFKVVSSYGAPLFSIHTKKDDGKIKISKIRVLNTMYQTEKNISLASSLGDVLKQYPNAKIEMERGCIELEIDEVGLEIYFETNGATEQDIKNRNLPLDAKAKYFVVEWDN